jgi:uncharacterized protein
LILVDANLLIYATISGFVEHQRSREWLDGRLNGEGRVGLPWPSLLAFLRVVTNSRIFPRPLATADAWRQADAWLGCETVWVPSPGERHADILARLLAGPGIVGNLVPDAHLAALAIEHGLELVSSDGDFARFPGLRWTNPLIA